MRPGKYANDELWFRRGYYMAVANIMRMRDEPTIAAEVLTGYGGINLDGIDDADLPYINQVIESENLELE